MCYCSLCDCDDRSDVIIGADGNNHYVCNSGHHHCIQDEDGYGYCIRHRSWHVDFGGAEPDTWDECDCDNYSVGCMACLWGDYPGDPEPNCNRRCAYCDDDTGNWFSDTGENEDDCSGTWVDNCNSGVAYKTKNDIESYSEGNPEDFIWEVFLIDTDSSDQGLHHAGWTEGGTFVTVDNYCNFDRGNIEEYFYGDAYNLICPWLTVDPTQRPTVLDGQFDILDNHIDCCYMCNTFCDGNLTWCDESGITSLSGWSQDDLDSTQILNEFISFCIGNPDPTGIQYCNGNSDYCDSHDECSDGTYCSQANICIPCDTTSCCEYDDTDVCSGCDECPCDCIEIPAEWTCDDSEFVDESICYCGCGVESEDQPGCREGEEAYELSLEEWGYGFMDNCLGATTCTGWGSAGCGGRGGWAAGVLVDE